MHQDRLRIPSVISERYSESHFEVLSPYLVRNTALVHEHATHQPGNKLLGIINGTSGGGKDTWLRKVLEAHPHYGWSKTATTRKEIRKDEVDDDPYVRLNEDQFQAAKDAGQFFEGNYYGSKQKYWYGSYTQEVVRVWDEGKTPILRLDPNGSKSIRTLWQQGHEVLKDTTVLSFFITPPSTRILRQRLVKREIENGTHPDQAESASDDRYNAAIEDLGKMLESHYILINHDNALDSLVDEFENIMSGFRNT